MLLGLAALTLFGYVALATLAGHLPLWLTIALSTLVTYVMFSVTHETTHNSLCGPRWINAAVGRFTWLFVVPTFSLPAWGYVHLQHHRYANDAERDPDVFATQGPKWQLPLRWALMDLFYAIWYVRHLPDRFRRDWRRPAAELAETTVLFCVGFVVLAVVAYTGHLRDLAVIVLIPQRIGIAILGWSFDWLPHHDLDATQRTDRYGASRIRLGLEWLLGPLMLSQNYHLVHHLHPWLPFYRYMQAWRRNEEAYLDHNPAMTTIFGRPVTADEVRRWQHRGVSAPVPPL
ncbi:fatty acid desaturase [Mycobacterium sp. M1]|uniref:Fatty acid desaturase n=1 Tax=Mycolicibacter acidiphilus TaxID=2835306 RepID=A0ABS5RJN5_9MYCO|nr:fatty acid desaturase [Mycolicibacter acidiphilus]MBS9533134.1 fatty acid desaturase [Mycolicibacter acidiphilus]